MCGNPNRIFDYHRAICRTLLLATILAGNAFASQDETHPALARYPSPEELQQRVDEFRAHDPEAWQAARADFDLAIRSHYTLGEQVPKVAGRKQLIPHVPPRWPRVTGLTTREALKGYIERLNSTPGAEARIQFYRDHMEDYCVDNTPTLRTALADVSVAQT